MTMIEKVARAIDPIGWAEIHPDEDYPAERERRHARKASSIMHARAAIEAMMDATPEMIRALKPGMDYEEAYTSMIKAALEEK